MLSLSLLKCCFSPCSILVVEVSCLCTFCTTRLTLSCASFRLGNDRYKTKIIYENLNPKWYEQFDLSLLEDHSQELEVTVWDKDQRSKDDFMGRCSVDLSKLEHEVTHKLWVDLEEGDGKLFILLTISGRANFDSPIPDLDSHQDEDEELEQRRIRSFALRNTLKDLNSVGHLKVSFSHYSKSQIFVQKFKFDKAPLPQHFHEFFTQIFFLTIFLVKSKLSTAKKSKTTSFHKFFTKNKIDNFLGKSKLNFWTKKEDFEQCVFQVFHHFSSSTLALKVLWTVCKLASLSHCYAYT